MDKRRVMFFEFSAHGAADLSWTNSPNSLHRGMLLLLVGSDIEDTVAISRLVMPDRTHAFFRSFAYVAASRDSRCCFAVRDSLEPLACPLASTLCFRTISLGMGSNLASSTA